MNLNLSSFLVPAPRGKTGTNGIASAPATTSTLKASNGPLFRSALDTHIDLVRVALSESKAAAGKTGAAVIDTVLDPAALEAQIAAKIEASLQQGGSFASAVSSLADKLAAAVANALGVTDDSARSQLSRTFAQALSPPGTAPPTSAEGARTLARRFRDVAETAARVAVDEGQQKRFLGNILDAVTAKDNPAPLKTDEKISASSYAFDPSSIAQAKVGSAVALPADESPKGSSSPASTTSPPPHPIFAEAPAAANTSGERELHTSTERQLFVRGFARKDLQGTGGDTLLGRTLARAAKAADVRDSNGARSGTSAPAPSSSESASAAVRPAPGNLLAPVQTKTAGLTPVQPQTVGRAPVRPQTAGLTPVQPQAAALTPVQAQATGSTLVQPETADLTPVQPQTDGLTPTSQAVLTSANGASGDLAAQAGQSEVAPEISRAQFPELRLVDRTPETRQPTLSTTDLVPVAPPSIANASAAAPASPFALPDGQALASKFADTAALTVNATGTPVHRGTPISHEIDTAIGVTAARNAEISVNATTLQNGTHADADPGNSGSGQRQGNSADGNAASSLVANAKAGAAPQANAALTAFFTAFEQARSAGASAPAPSSADDTSNSQTQSFLASIGASSNGSQPASVVIDGSVYTNATPHQASPDPDPHGVVDQVVKGVFLRNLGPAGSEVRLRLAPEHLGDVTVKLVVDGGSVSAQVLAQTPEARDALLGNQQQLTKTLADAGLKLQNFTVDLSNGNGFAQFNQQQQPQAQSRHMPLRMASNDEFEGADEETQLLAVPTFGPPIAAMAAGSSLNTLV